MKEVPQDLVANHLFLKDHVSKFAISEFTSTSLILVPRTPRSPSGVTYIYFDLDDTESIKDWFVGRPEGRVRMGLGTDKDVHSIEANLEANMLIMGLAMAGKTEEEAHAQGQWLIEKIDHGGFDMRLSLLRFPSGLMGYCNYFNMPEVDTHSPVFKQQLSEAMDEVIKVLRKEAERSQA